MKPRTHRTSGVGSRSAIALGLEQVLSKGGAVGAAALAVLTVLARVPAGCLAAEAGLARLIKPVGGGQADLVVCAVGATRGFQAAAPAASRPGLPCPISLLSMSDVKQLGKDTLQTNPLVKPATMLLVTTHCPQ